jgi:acetylornithine/N-succinyldiaminopimelate aminotransferase
MLNNGVLANATADNILRLVPPLNITQHELRRVVDVMIKSVEKLQKEHA